MGSSTLGRVRCLLLIIYGCLLLLAEVLGGAFPELESQHNSDTYSHFRYQNVNIGGWLSEKSLPGG